jgi:hypothetical protein
MQKTNIKAKGDIRLGKWLVPTLGLCLIGMLPNTAVAQSGTSPVSSSQSHTWTGDQAARSEITISGKIQQIITEHAAGTPQGVHIVLETSQGVIKANLGPYVGSDVAKSFSAGDEIQVAGMLRASNGQDFLLVRQLTQGDRQITIRNQHGMLVRAQGISDSRSHRAEVSDGGVQ